MPEASVAASTRERFMGMENSFGIPAGLTTPGRGNDPVLLRILVALLHVSAAEAAETAKNADGDISRN
jgi:hypothetical protein